MTLRIAMAQFDFPVGDVAGNAQRIGEMITYARDQFDADIVLFPELALSGYPPEDLLYRPSFLRDCELALDEVARTVEGIVANLDPHSAFLNAREYDEMRATTTGSYSGVGIEVSAEDGRVVVVTPAQRQRIARATRQHDLVTRHPPADLRQAHRKEPPGLLVADVCSVSNEKFYNYFEKLNKY